MREIEKSERNEGWRTQEGEKLAKRERKREKEEYIKNRIGERNRKGAEAKKKK